MKKACRTIEAPMVVGGAHPTGLENVLEELLKKVYLNPAEYADNHI